jgi:hypothetical protein
MSNINRSHTTTRMSKIVTHGDLVYLCGQNSGGTDIIDMAGQTQEVLRRIDELLKEAGTEKSKVLTALTLAQGCGVHFHLVPHGLRALDTALDTALEARTVEHRARWGLSVAKSIGLLLNGADTLGYGLPTSARSRDFHACATTVAIWPTSPFNAPASSTSRRTSEWQRYRLGNSPVRSVKTIKWWLLRKWLLTIAVTTPKQDLDSHFNHRSFSNSSKVR